jgi:hypothetical protein
MLQVTSKRYEFSIRNYSVLDMLKSKLISSIEYEESIRACKKMLTASHLSEYRGRRGNVEQNVPARSQVFTS